MDIVIKAARAELDDCFDRLDDCGADDELVAIARKCLEAHPGDRYANGTEVAEAVADYRAGVEERLRKAAKERVARQTEVREQYKRRRIQFALVGVIFLLALVGGAFAWWAERQAGRQAAAAQEQQLKEERAASEARERQQRNTVGVVLLLDQCEGHLKADEVDKAASVLAEIDRRVREGADNSFKPRLDRCRAALALLRELDRLDDVMWTVERDDARGERSAGDQWRDGLTKFQLNPATTPAERVHRTIRESLVRERILGTLDDWLGWENDTPVLVDFLRAADPDTYRNAVRSAFQQGNRAQLARLAAQPEALQQPIRFAAVMGNMVAVPFERREQILHAANRAKPDDFRVMRVISGIYPQGKESAAVRVRWSQAALALRPTNLAVWTNLGVALHDSGDIAGAIGAYRAALEHHKNAAGLYNNLGVALRAAEDLDGAIEAYQAGIRLNGEYPPLHNNLGTALKLKGRFAESATEYEQAIRLVPNNPGYRFNLGLTLALADDPDGAVRAYRVAIKLNPKFAAAHGAMGVSLEAKGDLDGAITAYDKAVELEPKNEKYQNRLKEVQKKKKGP